MSKPIAAHHVLVYLTIMIIVDSTTITTSTTFKVLTYSTEIYPHDPVS